MVRAWYCGAFAFMGGDTTKPNIAAGVSVSAMLRQELGYKGSVLWRMNAGMGDAVVAPLYQALVARGVRVELFHRVTALHPAENGARVDRIDLCRQVPSPGDYDPLVDVLGLPCWPNTPVWERLSGGDAWRTAGVDFEAEDGPEATGVTLRQGDDFDKVVLAISVAALPAICAELLADPRRPRFAAMVANASTCMTQGFQVWMNAGLTDGLGWKHGSDISSTYVEPLDTYCDMSQLIDAEAWPADAGVRSIAYFCGVLADRLDDTQDTATRRAHDAGVAFLRDCSGALWPGAVVGGGFDFGLLVDPDGADGEERFDRQFWRANFAATERYVLTPMGSVKHRLAAGDSEWDNLVYAGDWTHTGVDLGCVEAAVMSGMQASRALSGSPAVVHGEDHRWLAGHGRHGAPSPHG